MSIPRENARPRIGTRETTISPSRRFLEQVEARKKGPFDVQDCDYNPNAKLERRSPNQGVGWLLKLLPSGEERKPPNV